MMKAEDDPTDDMAAAIAARAQVEASPLVKAEDPIASPPPPMQELPFVPLPRAAELLFANSTEQQKLYWDRSHYDSPESQMKALAKSSTLYIGNLAFSTRSYHVYSHFSQIDRDDALCAVATLSGSKLDGRIIRVELDAGFQPGRQYGRGASGGQVRDERRSNQDAGRTSISNKKQKTLNWTPPEHVQQQQAEGGGDAAAGAPADAMAAAPATDDGGEAMGQQEQQPNQESSSNSRFRDEN
ncbi:MAG: hypothetical protein SGARI_002526 [Bacillariaceae sp.]